MPDVPSAAVDAAVRGDTYIVRVQGVLDREASAELELALAAAEDSSASRIKASRRSARDGDRLRVTRGRGAVARLFRLTALDQTVPRTEPARLNAHER